MEFPGAGVAVGDALVTRAADLFQRAFGSKMDWNHGLPAAFEFEFT
jgi:hypothetical protein